MKLSRDWLNDFIDLSDLTDAALEQRFTEIGHAVESSEKHGDDTVFDLEITTNRVDAMSHIGMARELAAALGRELRQKAALPDESGAGPRVSSSPPGTAISIHHKDPAAARIRIDSPELCSRYTALVIRNVAIKPSPDRIRRRLEAVGLRPINNVVDVTNYVMLAVGHPLHAFDFDKLRGGTIIVRAGRDGEKIRSLDGEMRTIDAQTIVIADNERPVALGGIIGGAESEISETTKNILLECAWFDPAAIRRTARRLGIKTDASYRFERRVDPNDTIAAVDLAGDLILGLAGGVRDDILDVNAVPAGAKKLTLRSARLHAASGGVAGEGYALELFRRLGFGAEPVDGGVRVEVPAYRGDVHEEMDLIEEVLRFFGLNNVPAELPRVTTGDVRRNVVSEAADDVRRLLAGCGLAEAITYSFVAADANAAVTDEAPVKITNALSEKIAAMRLSLLPGLLEAVAYNRGYGTRDGGLFEVGPVYRRDGERVREQHRAGIVLFGSRVAHWSEAKRNADFFDVKGFVEQVAAKFHCTLDFASAEVAAFRKGHAAIASHEGRVIATLGFLTPQVLQHFGVKGDVAAAEIDIEALIASESGWKMAPVARFPGVPMILALTHGRDLEYQRIIDTIRGLDVPFLHEVGLRDRYIPENEDTIKTTLGMWYQAFDRSLTQDEVTDIHRGVAERVAGLLPVKVL